MITKEFKEHMEHKTIHIKYDMYYCNECNKYFSSTDNSEDK